MRCWQFGLTDNPGVNHFELPSNPDVLARVITDANAPRSNCPWAHLMSRWGHLAPAGGVATIHPCG